ncbi:MAG: hypothetical protein GY747_00200 [Planctomycetes bacterium]|nr:hypothetical protein [Planctomycetota bacterium]MCP4770646.1 hypothetical protein [Planctomycetota bacterium]MCP4861027.1 hypothetical protein [Planctomycetota bacterium]
MISYLTTALAFAAIAASASAQTPQQASPSLQPAITPTALEYTMGEGYEVISQDQRSGPETIFNNRIGGIYYYITIPQTEEWVDEGSFALHGVNNTEQINGMSFDYCSSVPDPLGDGIDIELRFYEETIGFSGVSGWADANNRNEKCGYVIPGLPGDTTLAGLSCWAINLNLAGGFECTLPQEQTLGGMDNFGWSNMYLTASSIGATGPFLGGTSGYGVQDYYELYDLTQPLGSEYQGTFWFGGGPSVQANFPMSLEGNPTDTSAYYSATPGTADSIDLQADVQVRAGQPAAWTVTNPTAGSSYALIASGGSADVPGLVGGQAHLLVNWLGNPLLPVPVVMVGGSYLQLMPNALPPAVHVQAAEYSGALTPSNITAMSNGLRHAN